MFENLKEAKKNHDELEKLYIDAMDFDKTEKIWYNINTRYTGGYITG